MLTKLYTKLGDRGFTSTLSHGGISKSSPVMDSLGDIDELNSVIGLARSSLKRQIRTDRVLRCIQKNLISVSAVIASGVSSKGVTSKDTKFLEDLIDMIQEISGFPTEFVTFSGTQFQTLTQLARSVCRRAERSLWEIEHHHFLDSNPEIAKYINRLSDFFFALGLYGDDDDLPENDSRSYLSSERYGDTIEDSKLKSVFDVIMYRIADFQNFHQAKDWWYAMGMLNALRIEGTISKKHLDKLVSMVDAFDRGNNTSLVFEVAPYLENAIKEGPYDKE